METEDGYNFEKLKTFHIPRKNDQQKNKELLSELSVNSREFTHTILPAVKSTYFYPSTSRKLRFKKVEIISNNALQKDFLEKKKDLKDEGRTEKELAESYAFISCKDLDQVKKICKDGLEVGNTGLVSLGKPTMGVYLSKHLDVVSPSAFSSNESGFIILLKFIKGKTKVVMECRSATTTQEPTPLFDCHITKISGDPSKITHTRAFQSLQYYVYEYGDLDMAKRPRQILPYAVLHYTYSESDQTVPRKNSLNSMDTPCENTTKAEAVKSGSYLTKQMPMWKGKLLVRGGLFCSAKLVTDVNSALNVAFLDQHLNVKSSISIDKFAKQLPPTLLNKGGKRHNVIYRGRNFNIFMMVPCSENGLLKFGHLIASLVQSSSVACIPLRQSSCLYLMPQCELSQHKMALEISKEESAIVKNDFLYAVIVTPKNVTSKVNELRVSNLIHIRKKKDSHSNVPLELTLKLQQMNIDPISAIGSMHSNNISKLLQILKDKKRIQTSEKFLHHHYKDSERLLFTSKHQNRFSGKIGSLWSTTNQARQEYYAPKEKKTMPKPEERSKISSSKPRSSHSVIEATFSDEECVDMDIGSDSSESPIIQKKIPINDPRSRSNLSQDASIAKRKMSVDYSTQDSSIVPTKMSRPSFKPLEEVLSENVSKELFLHPDFEFSDRFCKTHAIMKGKDFGTTLDLERENQLSIIICQQVPFSVDKDCPYACDGDPKIKSMLRAVYGPWDGGNSSVDDREKVLWIRQILHLHKSLGSVDPRISSIGAQDRKIVEDGTVTTIKDSPQPPVNGSSSDSGFQTASTTTTPNAVGQNTVTSPKNSSLHDIASLIASALDQPSATSSDSKKQPQQNTIQNILKAISDTMPDNKEASNYKEPVSDLRSGPNTQSLPFGKSPLENIPIDLPQDPRLRRRSAPSHHRLNLPTYRFPLSTKAAESLPKDVEAALQEPSTHPSSVTSLLQSIPNPLQRKQEEEEGDTLMRTKSLGLITLHKGKDIGILQIQKSGDTKRPMMGASVLFPHILKSTMTMTRHIGHGGRQVQGHLKDSTATQAHLKGRRLVQVSEKGPTSQPDVSRTATGRTPKAQEEWNIPTIVSSREETLPRPLHTPESTLHGGLLKPIAASKMSTGRKIQRHGLSEDRGPLPETYPTGVTLQTAGARPTNLAEDGPPFPRVDGDNTAGATRSTNNFNVTPKTVVPFVSNVPSVQSPVPNSVAQTNRTTASEHDAGAISRSAIDSAFDLLKSLLDSKVLQSIVSNETKSRSVTQSPVSEPPTSSTSSPTTSVASSNASTKSVSLSLEDILRMREKKKQWRAKRGKLVLKTEQAKSKTTKPKKISVSQASVSSRSNHKEKKDSDNVKRSTDEAAKCSVSVEKSSSTPRQEPKQATNSVTTDPTTESTDSVSRNPSTNIDLTEQTRLPSSNLNSSTTPEVGKADQVTTSDERSDATTKQQELKTAETTSSTSNGEVLSELHKIVAEVNTGDKDELSNRLWKIVMQLKGLPSEEAQPKVSKDDEAENTEVQQLTSRNATDSPVTLGKPDEEPVTLRKPEDDPLTSGKLENEPVTVKTSQKDTVTSLESSKVAAAEDEKIAAEPSQTATLNKDCDHVKPDVIKENVASDDESVTEADGTNSVDKHSIQPETPAPEDNNAVPDDKSPDTAAFVAVEPENNEPLAHDRDTGTPTLDDTYNPQLEGQMQKSLGTSYYKFSALSEVCRGQIHPAGRVRRILATLLNDAAEQEENLQKMPFKKSLRDSNASKAMLEKEILRPRLFSKLSKTDPEKRESDSASHDVVPELTDPNENTQPSYVWSTPANSATSNKNQSNSELPKHSQLVVSKPSSGPSFYVFDPRGSEDCLAIETWLKSLQGSVFHTDHISEVIGEMPSIQEGNFTLITEELLETSLPPGTLWIVVRTTDLELLPSLPYLSLLKCAGPRVQFIRVDTVTDAENHNFSYVFHGEGGIIVPTSCDVVMNDYVIFGKLLAWMAKLKEKQLQYNVWKVALFSNILTELKEISENVASSKTALRETASYLLATVKDNEDSILNLQSPDDSKLINASHIFDTATKLQVAHANSVRHVVVIPEHSDRPDWSRLRSAGVAVATAKQFSETTAQAAKENLSKYSALMGIYKTEIA